MLYEGKHLTRLALCHEAVMEGTHCSNIGPRLDVMTECIRVVLQSF
jgi:hypothetical protein